MTRRDIIRLDFTKFFFGEICAFAQAFALSVGTRRTSF
jgi:hypothetical protein